MHSSDSGDTTADRFRMLMSLAFNVISSVGVIFINKRLVFMAAGFHFATALTIIHFVVCFLGCLAFARGGFFEWKSLRLSNVVGISLAFCGYVAFNNLSLLTNSVSVYQISKILGTPVLIALEYITQGKTQSRETLLSLVPVCLGIFITVWTDTDVNAIGTFWACLAVVANAFYTMWGNSKQRELEVTPMQLLSYQAPMSAAMLCLTLPIFEPWHDLMQFIFTPRAVTYILLSCAFAFGVNFSFFLSVGATSSLTLNVLGYVKTCLIFVGGFVFFDSVATWQSILGITLTMAGFAMYTKTKLPPSPAPPPPAAHHESGGSSLHHAAQQAAGKQPV